jgi:hypothetical protein
LYLPHAQTGQRHIHEVACNAHARRKFHEARGSNAAGAHQALAYYGQLYEIERRAQGTPEEVRLQMRQDLAVPILEQFHAWLLEQAREALPKSSFGEAVSYALNHSRDWPVGLGQRKRGLLGNRPSELVVALSPNWQSVGFGYWCGGTSAS